MSHYRDLIEKLTGRHTERDDFEELHTLSTEALSELSAKEKEDLERHSSVIVAAALSKAKGNVKLAVDTLKSIQKRFAAPIQTVPAPIQTVPAVFEEKSSSGFSWKLNSYTIVFFIWLVILFVLLVVIRRR